MVILSGATGSGKSTQVPQIILDHFLATKRNPRIVVTQPRRIAALSLCERVKDERGIHKDDFNTASLLQSSLLYISHKFICHVISPHDPCPYHPLFPLFILIQVGYSVQYDYHGSQSQIEFCTVGLLLRRLVNVRPNSSRRLTMSDEEVTYQLSLKPEDEAYWSDSSSAVTKMTLAALENVTHLVVDEVHERNKLTDFLLILLRDAVKLRPDLRVIIMSATLEAALFSGYFGGNVPVLVVEGRTHPVRSFFLEDTLRLINYRGIGETERKHGLNKQLTSRSSSKNMTMGYNDLAHAYQDLILHKGKVLPPLLSGDRRLERVGLGERGNEGKGVVDIKLLLDEAEGEDNEDAFDDEAFLGGGSEDENDDGRNDVGDAWTGFDEDYQVDDSDGFLLTKTAGYKPVGTKASKSSKQSKGNTGSKGGSSSSSSNRSGSGSKGGDSVPLQQMRQAIKALHKNAIEENIMFDVLAGLVQFIVTSTTEKRGAQDERKGNVSGASPSTTVKTAHASTINKKKTGNSSSPLVDVLLPPATYLSDQQLEYMHEPYSRSDDVVREDEAYSPTTSEEGGDQDPLKAAYDGVQTSSKNVRLDEFGFPIEDDVPGNGNGNGNGNTVNAHKVVANHGKGNGKNHKVVDERKKANPIEGKHPISQGKGATTDITRINIHADSDWSDVLKVTQQRHEDALTSQPRDLPPFAFVPGAILIFVASLVSSFYVYPATSAIILTLLYPLSQGFVCICSSRKAPSGTVDLA